MADLPTGTVTFLFTDIEGSTRLWADGRETMHGALERHDDILRAAIEDNGGFVFATGGDGFSAVFRSAQDALAASVTAQVVLAAEDWAEAPLRVRMGIHTGEAEERDHNYFGPAVNESARLMSAGHGGQILVSETAQRIVANRLPDGVVLVDLGEHRLKDVEHPIAVYQVTHPELAVEFPLLRGWADTRNNLPSQLTSFVGRERELVELKKLLERSRLVTLTGAGGSGKTRLALELAGNQLDAYPDGVWFVDLATLDDPLVVGAAVAATLGVADVPGQKILDRLVGRLSDEETLLIVDNCEHLVDAAASLTSELLKRTKALAVVATSREPLGVTGESSYPVPTLADTGNGDPEFSDDGPAVRLFVDRAALARPGLLLSQDDVLVVASICRRLDGLPLALELAAARLSILSLDQLLDRLDDRFALLVGGARDRLPRQQTLTATIDWSYELLTDEEQALFGRLSVFSGGFTLDTAEEICAGDGVAADRVLDLVSSLVDKSLLVAEQGRAGSRFGLLETMREYAAARLSAGAKEQLQKGHAAYFQRLVVDSFDELWGRDEMAWLDRLEDEWPNIRRALFWHLDHMTQDGLLMAGTLYRFAFRRLYSPEVLVWLERFIAAEPTPSLARARALMGMGTLSFEQTYLMDAIDLYREFGSGDELAQVLINASNRAKAAGDWESARSMATEADSFRDPTDPGPFIEISLLAEVALQADQNPTQAIELAEKFLASAQESKSPRAIVSGLQDLGEYRRHAGDLEGAEIALREAQDLEAHMSEREVTTGGSDYYLSQVALDRGDIDQAVLHLAALVPVIRRFAELDDLVMYAAFPLHIWAELAVRQNAHTIAVTLLGAQTRAHDESSWRVQPPTEQADAEKTLNKARAALDPEEFETAWEEGMKMNGLEALEYAVQEIGQKT